MTDHGELNPEDYLTPEQDEELLRRLRYVGLRRRSLEQPDPPRPRWRLLIGLTCGHRYWVRWHGWRFVAAFPHLYCPDCDVLQPVTVGSRRKARKRMYLSTSDLRGMKDQPPKPARIGHPPRQWPRDSTPHTLEASARELPRPATVERMKTRRGLRADLVCGHAVRLDADRVRLAIDPGEIVCPKGDGRQRVTPATVARAKARLRV